MGWEILNLDFRNDILEDLFRCSDLESLKTFRLVCKLWEKEARRVLSKRLLIKSEKGSLLSLQSTILSSPNPQYFFTSFQLTLTSPINLITQKLLQEFGHHLKTLRTTSGQLSQFNANENQNNCRNLFNLIYSLIVTKWCPNLEVLSIISTSTTSNANCSQDNYQQQLSCVSSRAANLIQHSTLKLKILELEGSVLKNNSNFCLSLIKSSPELKKLRIKFSAFEIPEEKSVIISFFETLCKYPEIIGNLVEFSLVGLKVPGLMEILSSLDFSDKLKKLVISGSTNVSDPVFESTFVRLLEKVSNSVESLKIYKCSCHHCEWRNWKHKHRFLDIQGEIPRMKKVRILEISTASGSYGIGTIDLLQKFPNLETFILSSSEVGHDNSHRTDITQEIDYFFQNFQKVSKISKNCDNNLRNLKRLEVNHTISKMSSINFIVENFLRVNSLLLAIRSDVKYCWEVQMEAKFSLPTAMEILTKMEQLTELTLRLDEDTLYLKLEIERAVKIIKAFPQLRRFTLIYGKLSSASSVFEITLPSTKPNAVLHQWNNNYNYNYDYDFSEINVKLIGPFNPYYQVLRGKNEEFTKL